MCESVFVVVRELVSEWKYPFFMERNKCNGQMPPIIFANAMAHFVINNFHQKKIYRKKYDSLHIRFDERISFACVTHTHMHQRMTFECASHSSMAWFKSLFAPKQWQQHHKSVHEFKKKKPHHISNSIQTFFQLERTRIQADLRQQQTK